MGNLWHILHPEAAQAHLASITRFGIPALISSSLTSWSALFALVHWGKRQRSALFANRAVSLVHALLAMLLCYLALPAQSLTAELARVGHRNTRAEEVAIAISLGYFVYDTVCCLAIAAMQHTLRTEVANSIHHGVSIAGLLAGLGYGKCGPELVLALLLVESSNPFLHARTLLADMGMKQRLEYKVTELLFALSYMIMRIVLGPVLMYKTLQSAVTPPFVKVGAVGLQLVSIFWFYEIILKAKSKLQQTSAKRKHH